VTFQVDDSEALHDIMNWGEVAVL